MLYDLIVPSVSFIIKFCRKKNNQVKPLDQQYKKIVEKANIFEILDDQHDKKEVIF